MSLIQPKTTEDNKKTKTSSPSKFIVISLMLGIFSGLFLGELAAPAKIVGDAYIGLLQMTVLPYLLFSLMANIGRLTSHQASVLVRIGIMSMLTLWLIAGSMVFILSFSFPTIPSGSFFSASLIQQPVAVDFVGLFIPSNIFQSLASNATPAIVLFCFLFGSALMGMENKAGFLTQLDFVVQILQKVNSIIIKLTPIGIFAIAASATGTMTLSEFGRLQAYLTTMTVGVLLLSLLIYPMIISLCTPLRWQRVLHQSRDAILAAFVLGSIFAVIPLLIETVNKLFSEINESDDLHTPELMLPLAYPFPDSGKVLTLLFIPFAAWFYGTPLDINDFGLLVSSGIFSLFGKLITAVPFLLDIFKVPNDIFQLFLASGVLMGRVADIAAAMHLITFTIITTAFIKGIFKPRWPHIFLGLAITLAISLGIVSVLNSLFFSAYKDSFAKEDVILSMQKMEKDVPITILEQASSNPMPLSDGKSHGERIEERGILRVGYIPDRLPFSFFNSAGDLVGFDIDLMQELALDLNVALEFVPYDLENIEKGFTEDHFDIAISGITATNELSAVALFSEPYLYVNMAMVIPDSVKKNLDTERDIAAIKALRVAVKEGSYFINRAKAHFPDMELISIKSERDFFIASSDKYDALLTTAEGGSTWTLLYPGYTTINPVERTESAPLIFALPRDMDIEEYLEVWLELKQLDGTSESLFNYWILGIKETQKHPRWSIIRDVLHWVD